MLNENPNAIIVRCPNWIGDQILAYPFFYFLRKEFPKAHIRAVCVPWVFDVQFRDCVDAVTVIPVSRKQTFATRIRIINEVAKDLRCERNWDLGFSLPNSWSAAGLLFRSGVKIRVGYRTEGRGILLNSGLKWDASPTRHRSQAYLDLLNHYLGSNYDSSQFWIRPVEDPVEASIGIKTQGEIEFFDYRSSWAMAQFHPKMDFKYWILAPGATAESRRWDPFYFAEVARRVYAEKGWKGLIVGGQSEKKIAEQLLKFDGTGLIDYTARGTVAELADLFSGAQITLSNESGLAHVASLCGSPVQIVCGAADPRRTTPLGPGKVQVAMNPVSCWPCEKNLCINEGVDYLKCLRGITVDRVVEEMFRVAR
jgi:heptosyltransferase-2